jgi:hypothetical protein
MTVIILFRPDNCSVPVETNLINIIIMLLTFNRLRINYIQAESIVQ